MPLSDLITAGGANPILLFGTALLLGALHGLEPGHSKTMIAAYIIAVRGTVGQAVLLGVSAAISHSIIVWVLAILALTYGNALIGEDLEPWFMMASGWLIIAIALWMLWRQDRTARASILASTGDAPIRHNHDHTHNHGHADDHGHAHGHVHFHNSHSDAHARAHAREIEARLTAGRTSTWQTMLFGLSGGLIPCPAAITIFLLCLQLGRMTLGIVLVSAFSIGLAATLVLVGAIAALGLRAITRRTSKFDRFANAAPWASAALIALVGCAMIYAGWHHLAHGGPAAS